MTILPFNNRRSDPGDPRVAIVMAALGKRPMEIAELGRCTGMKAPTLSLILRSLLACGKVSRDVQKMHCWVTENGVKRRIGRKWRVVDAKECPWKTSQGA